MKTKNRAILKTEESETEHSVILVRVVGQAVGENGQCFTKGTTFETTPERAIALGPLVEILN